MTNPPLSGAFERFAQALLPLPEFPAFHIERLRRKLFHVVSALAVVIPLLEIETLLYSAVTPKFALLLVGSALLITLMGGYALRERQLTAIQTPICFLVGGLVLMIGVSALFSLSPIISLVGSLDIRTGFLTYAGYLVCFLALTIALTADRIWLFRFFQILVLPGIGVSLLGFYAFFHQPAAVNAADPLLFRLKGTLGHADYAGNFLLFTLFAALAATVVSTKSLWKWINLAAAAVMLAAILFTGTRGAWAGLGVAGVVGLILVFRERSTFFQKLSPQQVRQGWIVTGCLLLVFGGLVWFTPIGHTVRTRLAGTVQEGFTGAGRTTLWKWALRVVPDYWATGCGPEMYRLACLNYITADDARATSGLAVEDPHNLILSYLVNYGAFSSVMLLVIVGFAFISGWQALKKSTTIQEKGVSLLLILALLAVTIDLLFIYFTLTTGLYFFGLIAIIFVWNQQLAKESTSASSVRSSSQKTSTRHKPAQSREFLVWGLLGTPVLAAVIYLFPIVAAEYTIYQSMDAARQKNTRQCLELGQKAFSYGLYQTDHHYYFARALEAITVLLPDSDQDFFLTQAAAEAEKALPHGLFPDQYRFFQARLLLQNDQIFEADTLSDEIETINPHYFGIHVIRAQVALRLEQLDQAQTEIAAAKALNGPRRYISPLNKQLKQARGIQRPNRSKTKHKSNPTFD
ncbi:MAG: O-antigen ligase family protein [Acidobacteria bacterium]|nr:O-antigen ligase family protein [Acidobacteriota bacterium]